MDDKLKVASRLNPEYLREYIVKRFKEKFPEIEKEGLKWLDESIKEFKEISFIIFEDYNLPSFHYRCYKGGNSYTGVAKDYFEDEPEDCVYDVGDLGCIYDVDKDKFIKLTLEIKEHIEEV